jgi:hypothetical protein
MKSFKELIVWEKSHRLALQVYGDTRRFPKEELYGLTSQMRRSSVSIPTNIAEGCGRNRDSELNRFFEIAMGLPVNWNISFCSPVISVFWAKKNLMNARA